MKFMLVNNEFNDVDVFTIGEFESVAKALRYASKMADGLRQAQASGE